MKVRDPFFDVVKAVAIFMVLFCHVMWFAPVGTFPQWINNFRVGMNMPIFFVVSGYFVLSTIEAVNWSKFWKSLRSYFHPAFFAAIFFTACGLAMGIISPTVRSVSLRVVRGVFVDPWFITTLAECFTLLFVAKIVGRRWCWTLLIVTIVWATIVCRPSCVPGSIHWRCLVSMLPHYVFGAVVLRKLNCRLWENWRIGLPSLVAFVVFVLLEGNVATNGMSFYNADSTVRAFQTLRGGVAFILRPLVGIIGSIGVMWLVWMALKVVPQLKCLAKIGTLTLGIYIFHLWPLERLRGIAWIGSSRWSVLITSIAMLVFFSVVTWLLMEKTGRFRKWIWGK